MRALTFEGAAGWAWGSHEWKGTTPAFAPNPKKASTKAIVATDGTKARPRKAANSNEPAQTAMEKKDRAIIKKPIWAMMR